jgi:hypothetical protein
MARCLRRFGAVPRTLVWDREGALHAGGGRCPGEGVVERLHAALGAHVPTARNDSREGGSQSHTPPTPHRPVGRRKKHRNFRRAGQATHCPVSPAASET